MYQHDYSMGGRVKLQNGYFRTVKSSEAVRLTREGIEGMRKQAESRTLHGTYGVPVTNHFLDGLAKLM